MLLQIINHNERIAHADRELLLSASNYLYAGM